MATIHERITELQRRTRAGDEEMGDRQKRMEAIEALAEEYGLRPSGKADEKAVERLTDLCLYEELSDPTSWKSRQNEYPFLSELQMARRRDGVHQRRYEGGIKEVSMDATATYGSDGRLYGDNKRRERSRNEERFMDENVRSRNEERKRKYKEFTKVQPVFTYNLYEITDLVMNLPSESI